MTTLLDRLTRHTTLGLFILVITLCIVLSYHLVNLEFCIASLVFNLFFTSLFFQLSGVFKLKVAFLTAGNVIRLFWNLLFQNLAFNGRFIFGDSFQRRLLNTLVTRLIALEQIGDYRVDQQARELLGLLPNSAVP